MTHDPNETGPSHASGENPSLDPSASTPGAGEIPAKEALHLRRIRSFVTRAGRVSNGQRRALDELSPRFVVPFSPQPPDWDDVFTRLAPRILEIGFGMGATTAEIASLRPGDDFIGVEVHEPGVGALLKLMEEQGLPNIRIVQHDAVEVLEQMIAPESLDGVHIFFPDPWHKARHHKRRLIQPGFVALLASRMKPGAYLHCATDWQNYAEQMLEVLNADPVLVNTVEGLAGLCAPPRVSSGDEVRTPRPAARARRVGSGVHPAHSRLTRGSIPRCRNKKSARANLRERIFFRTGLRRPATPTSCPLSSASQDRRYSPPAGSPDQSRSDTTRTP